VCVCVQSYQIYTYASLYRPLPSLFLSFTLLSFLISLSTRAHTHTSTHTLVYTHTGTGGLTTADKCACANVRTPCDRLMAYFLCGNVLTDGVSTRLVRRRFAHAHGSLRDDDLRVHGVTQAMWHRYHEASVVMHAGVCLYVCLYVFRVHDCC